MPIKFQNSIHKPTLQVSRRHFLKAFTFLAIAWPVYQPHKSSKGKVQLTRSYGSGAYGAAIYSGSITQEPTDTHIYLPFVSKGE